VAAQVARHQYVPQPECEHQEPLDIGAEAEWSDRLIKQAGRDNAVAEQRGDERLRLAVPAGESHSTK
jgi:hypothetical protein